MALISWVDHDGSYIVKQREETPGAALSSYETLMAGSLGCARIEESQREVVLTARLSGLSGACAAILIQFIDSNHRQYAQITVRDVGDHGNTLTTLDHEAAKEFILASDIPAVTAVPRTLISKRLLSDILFRDDLTPQLRVFSPVLDAWRERQVTNSDDDDASDTAIWKAAESAHILGRVGIVSGEGNGAIYQRYLGAGLNFLTAEERRQLIGQRLSAQPDREFGCWLEAELDWCLRSDEPQLFACSGIIKNSENRQTEVRNWYRLTLPLTYRRRRSLMTVTLPRYDPPRRPEADVLRHLAF